MKTLVALLAVTALGWAPALADPPEQVGEPAELDKQPSAPGVVIAVPAEGAVLLTNVVSSDYPPPVVIVDGEVVNRF